MQSEITRLKSDFIDYSYFSSEKKVYYYSIYNFTPIKCIN